MACTSPEQIARRVARAVLLAPLGLAALDGCHRTAAPAETGLATPPPVIASTPPGMAAYVPPPDASAPDVTAPDASAPDANTLDARANEVSTPDAHAPDASRVEPVRAPRRPLDRPQPTVAPTHPPGVVVMPPAPSFSEAPVRPARRNHRATDDAIPGLRRA